jgi:hypothetical protein
MAMPTTGGASRSHFPCDAHDIPPPRSRATPRNRPLASPPHGCPVPLGTQVLGQVIKGFRAPLSDQHRSLLLTALLPLHKNNEMYEWRDQVGMHRHWHPHTHPLLDL